MVIKMRIITLLFYYTRLGMAHACAVHPQQLLFHEVIIPSMRYKRTTAHGSCWQQRPSSDTKHLSSNNEALPPYAQVRPRARRDVFGKPGIKASSVKGPVQPNGIKARKMKSQIRSRL
jgi:hypothetical protein